MVKKSKLKRRITSRNVQERLLKTETHVQERRCQGTEERSTRSQKMQGPM